VPLSSFFLFLPKPDENRQNPVIFESHRYLRFTQEPPLILARSGIVAEQVGIHILSTVPAISNLKMSWAFAKSDALGFTLGAVLPQQGENCRLLN